MKKYIVIGLLSVFMISCVPQKEIGVLYVNSYHEGYPGSDKIMQTVQEELSDKKITMETFYLDSKHKTEEESIMLQADMAFSYAQEVDPDLIILSDDNAVKYFGKTYNDTLGIPFVFCGVNWDHRSYELPDDQFTGILDIFPVRESINYLKKTWPDASSLGILSENTTSEKKNQIYLNTITGMKNHYRLADDFDQWKIMFLELNEKCDFIFLPSNGAIKNWRDDEAERFILKNIKVPVFTCDDFMMKFSMFGITKIDSEQGEWTAKTAWMILNGKNIKEIPVAKNQKTVYWINPKIAGKINFVPDNLKEFRFYPEDYPIY